MKVNVSVLVGCVLCVMLMAFVGVMLRVNESQGAWSPNDIYSQVGGSSYSDVSHSPSASSDKVTVSMHSRSSRRYVAAPAFSYAQGYSAPMASTQYPIGGTPSNSVASPIYTTSSAMYRSFGGGGMSGAASGSARNTRAASESVATSLSMPSVSSYAMLPRDRQYAAISAEDMQGVEMMASAMSYTPITSSISAVGATTVEGSYSGSLFGPRRKAAPTTGGGWDKWLGGLGAEDGYLYSDAEGNRYYDLALLHQAFIEAQKNGNFPGWDWEMFLNQFFNQTTKHQVPHGSPWVLLLLALGYVAVRWGMRRSRARA